MSLDQFHHFVTAGQFMGLLGPAPGVKDKRYKIRRLDGDMYLSNKNPSTSLLSRLKLKIQSEQGLIRISGDAADSLNPQLIGNTMCYELLSEAVLRINDGVKPAGTDDMQASYLGLLNKTQSFIEGVVPPVASDAADMSVGSVDGHSLLLKSASEELLDLYSVCTNDHQARLARFKGEGEDPWRGGGTRKGKLFEVYSMGSLVMVKVGKVSHLLTPEHFRRIPEQLLRFRNLTMLFRDLIRRSGPVHIDLINLICRLGVTDQANVGAGFRVLRAYVMAKGADRETTLSNVVKDTLSSFDGIKREMGDEIIELCESLTDSYSELTQMGNLYKFVISPDISMKSCFDAAIGAKEPNHPTEGARRKFRGLLRKRMYLSLMNDNIPPHAKSDDTEFQAELDRPTPNREKLEKMPLHLWSAVKFEPLKQMQNYKDIKLRTNDKSSAVEMEGSPDAELSSYNIGWLSGGRPDPLPNVEKRKSNDILAALESGDKLNPKAGYGTFKGLVKAHKKLERRLMRGAGIESHYDIPSDLLTPEILADKNLHYTVNTEPKEGEKHKPAGRLFYMATREMKAFISAVERLCRTAFHGQVGNSIISSYMRRMEQLRTMARATSHKSDELLLYFVSFDMSEFSKKFPMELVNEIGDLFAELTGDPFLSRLDVIFRAGIVVHSTRGFEGVFAGVRGGFEGFLNFVWTAAHVTVMELALLSSQKQGLVMAYSDDGLLEMVMRKNDTREAKKAIVQTIQETYKDLGLTFHLYKTLVACNVFEYLGLVAKDGRFVDTWGKALSNFGIRERRAAFTPMLENVDIIVGQASATVEALAPVDLIYYHMLVEVYLILRRQSHKLTMDQLITLMYLPRSMGGLGIPSQMDMIMTTERPRIESFLHTASRLIDTNNTAMSHALEVIVSMETAKEGQMRSLILGGDYASDVPSMDPTPITAALAETAASKAGLEEVGNPLTATMVAKIRKLTSCFENLPAPLISRLLSSTPKMQAYQQRLDVASSRGAYNYLGRQEIQHAQRRDTLAVKASMRFWLNEFRRVPSLSPLQSLERFIMRINRTMISLGFAPVRPRAESLMTVSRNPSDAIIFAMMRRNSPELLNNPKRAKKLDDAIFAAPDMTSGAPDKTPTFDTTEPVELGLPSKMLKMIARILTVCPESLDALLAMTSLLGAEIPDIPAGVKGNLNRLRALLRGKMSITLRIPQAAFALTTIEPMGELENAARRGEINDFSTHIMVARAIMAVISDRLGILSSPPRKGHLKYWFRMAGSATVRNILYEPRTKCIAKVPCSLLPMKRDTLPSRTFSRNGIEKLISEMRARVEMIGISEASAEIRDHITQAIAMQLAKRISMRISCLPTRVIVGDTFSTDDDRTNAEVMRLAYLEVARMQLSPRGQTPSEEECLTYLDVVFDLREELPGFMNIDSFRGMLFDGTYGDYLASTRIATLVSAGLRSATVVGDINHGKVYRELLGRTLKDMYDSLNDRRSQFTWNTRLKVSQREGAPLVPDMNVGMGMDQILDGITAIQASLRPSSHRSTPYNLTTFIINYVKVRVIAFENWSIVQHSAMTKDETIEYAKKSRLSRSSEALLIAVLGRRVGPDHRKIIQSSLGTSLAKRCAIYTRLRHRHRSLPQIRSERSMQALVSEAEGMQTMLYQAIMVYMNRFVVNIPTDSLKSTEVSQIMSGVWQMRQIGISTVGVVERTSPLNGYYEGQCIASQMIILARKTVPQDVAISVMFPLEQDLSCDPPFSGGLGSRNVMFAPPGEITNDSTRLVFEPYPGETEHEIGSAYMFTASSDTAAPLVLKLARLSAMSEIVADIVHTNEGFSLMAALIITNNQLESREGTSSASSSVTSTGSSVVSFTRLHEKDALLLTSSTLDVVGKRRGVEAGFEVPESDELTMEVPVLLAGDTGIGASRRGGWEGRIVDGEYGLVAATTRGHVLAGPHELVVAAAMGWCALRLDPGVSGAELVDETRSKIHAWAAILNSSPAHTRRYARKGIIAEISEILCWLRAQNFRLPISQSVPEEMLVRIDAPTSQFHEVSGVLTITSFTNSDVPVGDVRMAARTLETMSELSFMHHSGREIPDEPAYTGVPMFGSIGFLEDLSDLDELSSESGH